MHGQLTRSTPVFKLDPNFQNIAPPHRDRNVSTKTFFNPLNSKVIITFMRKLAVIRARKEPSRQVSINMGIQSLSSNNIREYKKVVHELNRLFPDKEKQPRLEIMFDEASLATIQRRESIIVKKNLITVNAQIYPDLILEILGLDNCEDGRDIDVSNFKIDLGLQKDNPEEPAVKRYLKLQKKIAKKIPTEANRPTIEVKFEVGPRAKYVEVGFLGGIGCLFDAEYMCELYDYLTHEHMSGTMHLLSSPPPRNFEQLVVRHFKGKRAMAMYVEDVKSFFANATFDHYVSLSNTSYCHQGVIKGWAKNKGNLVQVPDVFVKKIAKKRGPGKVLVVATTDGARFGYYARRMNKMGIAVVMPSRAEQESIQSFINDAKHGDFMPPNSDSESDMEIDVDHSVLVLSEEDVESLAEYEDIDSPGTLSGSEQDAVTLDPGIVDFIDKLGEIIARTGADSAALCCTELWMALRKAGIKSLEQKIAEVLLERHRVSGKKVGRDSLAAKSVFDSKDAFIEAAAKHFLKPIRRFSARVYDGSSFTIPGPIPGLITSPSSRLLRKERTVRAGLSARKPQLGSSKYHGTTAHALSPYSGNFPQRRLMSPAHFYQKTRNLDELASPFEVDVQSPSAQNSASNVRRKSRSSLNSTSATSFEKRSILSGKNTTSFERRSRLRGETVSGLGNKRRSGLNVTTDSSLMVTGSQLELLPTPKTGRPVSGVAVSPLRNVSVVSPSQLQNCRK